MLILEGSVSLYLDHNWLLNDVAVYLPDPESFNIDRDWKLLNSIYHGILGYNMDVPLECPFLVKAFMVCLLRYIPVDALDKSQEDWPDTCCLLSNAITQLSKYSGVGLAEAREAYHYDLRSSATDVNPDLASKRQRLSDFPPAITGNEKEMEGGDV